MTSASNQMITRCPKCGTAFRVTPSQLQSAKGAVRCGSCLNVFKAQEYLVASTATPAAPKNAIASPSQANASTQESSAAEPQQAPTAPLPTAAKPAAANQPTILSAIKPLAGDIPKPAATTPIAKPVAVKTEPVIRTIDRSSLGSDDTLISDDMEDNKEDVKSYEFDGFIDVSMAPKSDISLFERKIRDKTLEEQDEINADESWAEMLIEDDEDTPQLGVLKPKTDEQLADDELFDTQATNTIQQDNATKTPTKAPVPGLVFSLIGEKEDESSSTQQNPQTEDEFILSDELAQIPSNQGFNQPSATTTAAPLDPSIFETPEEGLSENGDPKKRQVKTQPKIRAYDGSRTALLMNIIPAPIEFSAKRMRRWYQRKLWPSLSILCLLTLVAQVGWFKFDYFSRVEPYRTGYLFLCPYLGCQVPTLVDTSRIVASNLVVREHPDTQGALAVDVMLINSAPFEQPFPDLVLVFTDIDDNQVASRRFTPKDYLGGELVGRELMPHDQKIYITLDLVDPGAEAVNYHISIPRQ